MEVTTSAPGKLIVVGEYAVLEGAESLVWAVDRRARVSAAATDEADLVVEAPEIGVERALADVDGSGFVRWHGGVDAETCVRLRMVGTTVTGVVHELAQGGAELPRVHVCIDTSAFLSPETGDKLGVGSSAAVVTAFTGAMLAFAGKTVEDEAGRRRVFERALHIHHQAQGGIGSGIDVAASTFGGALRYRRGRSPEETATPRRTEPPPELHWLAVWSGRAASTPSMVTAVQGFARNDPPGYERLLADLAATSEGACDAFADREAPAFLEQVGAFEEVLTHFGLAAGVDIISAAHQRIGSVVRAEGGVYKPSGAGGGDLGLAFANDVATIDTVAAALGRDGVTVVPLGIDENGMRLEP